MTVLGIFEVVALLATVAALLIVLAGWRRGLQRDTKLLLIGLLAVATFHYFSNTLEWLDLSAALDPFEDFVELLEPMFWLFLLYAFLRGAAEQDLRDSREQFRSLVETTSDWVWQTDEDLRYTYASPKARELLGYEPQEIVGRTPLDLMPAAEAQRVAVGLHALLEAHQPFAGVRKTIRRKDGRLVVLDTSGVPFFDGRGGFRGYRGIDRDITDRIRAEEERRKFEEQIRHAQKLESLGVLAGGIAHDFNNLLVGILGNADLAMMDLPPGSPALRSLQGIKTAGIRASELTGQMLAYSGRGRLTVQSVDLNEVIREMSHLLKASVSKTAALKLDLADALPPVDGDPAQVRQVVMNLIINASEAIGEKDGTIAVSTGVTEADEGYLAKTYLASDAPPGRYVFAEVSDTGCGMDEEVRSKLFDPFFTTKFTGRGLGLAAVLGIVRGHGGAIKVRSEVGRGSTFRVLLPPGAGAPQPALAPAEVPAEWRGRGTILVADDEESVRKVVAAMLRAKGFEVLTASDGLEAIETFRRHAEEVVAAVVDLTMPRASGEEVLQELRRIRPGVPVILSSGFDESRAAARLADLDRAGFLHKPFELVTLLAKLREVLPSAG